MKKTISLVITLTLCISFVIVAFGAENNFVPSITYKDAISVISAVMDGEDVSECLVVTTLKEASEKSTDITQEDRDTLQQVYKDLKEGTTELPIDENYVIRELVDLSFKYDSCRKIKEHGAKDHKLGKDGVILTVDFDFGISANEEVMVWVCIEGEWKEIERVENNGDGTITCDFGDICPVAFAVKQSATVKSPLKFRT